MNEPTINLTTPSGDNIELSSVLLSGKDVKDDQMTTLYFGSTDLEDVHNSLYYANRAVIRILVDRIGIPFDDIDEFLVSALSEAMVKEYNIRVRGRNDIENKIAKSFRKNQY